MAHIVHKILYSQLVAAAAAGMKVVMLLFSYRTEPLNCCLSSVPVIGVIFLVAQRYCMSHYFVWWYFRSNWKIFNFMLLSARSTIKRERKGEKLRHACMCAEFFFWLFSTEHEKNKLKQKLPNTSTQQRQRQNTEASTNILHPICILRNKRSLSFRYFPYYILFYPFHYTERHAYRMQLN